jgi:hypothetical protein
MLIAGRNHFVGNDRPDRLLTSDDRHREKSADHKYHWQVFHFLSSLQGECYRFEEMSIGRASFRSRKSRALAERDRAIHVEITHPKTLTHRR